MVSTYQPQTQTQKYLCKYVLSYHTSSSALLHHPSSNYNQHMGYHTIYIKLIAHPSKYNLHILYTIIFGVLISDVTVAYFEDWQIFVNSSWYKIRLSGAIYFYLFLYFFFFNFFMICVLVSLELMHPSLLDELVVLLISQPLLQVENHGEYWVIWFFLGEILECEGWTVNVFCEHVNC